ncbi:MAG: hypothetical protein Q4C91_06795 [Eubacteriales bacterium]|nr:hypothetical protein [Eubacteriales bacterium]
MLVYRIGNLTDKDDLLNASAILNLAFQANRKVFKDVKFETTLKGENCIEISRNLLNGNLTYLEAAKEYDEDCLKTAISLGLDWGL